MGNAVSCAAVPCRRREIGPPAEIASVPRGKEERECARRHGAFECDKPNWCSPKHQGLSRLGQQPLLPGGVPPSLLHGRNPRGHGGLGHRPPVMPPPRQFNGVAGACMSTPHAARISPARDSTTVARASSRASRGGEELNFASRSCS